MGRRLEAMEETRRRITAAAFELHATIGPSRTTVSAIAERAGVQRHTVYAHFPDVESLFEACTRHGMDAMAMPDPDPWAAIDDPADRLGQALRELYVWYRANEALLRNLLQDDPSGTPPTEPDPFTARMAAIVSMLAAGGPTDGRPDSGLHRAIVAHAVDFTTWRSLAGAGLSDDQVADLLVAVASRVSDGSIAIGQAPVRR
jgi:AcrR family transcriptional regulator